MIQIKVAGWVKRSRYAVTKSFFNWLWLNLTQSSPLFNSSTLKHLFMWSCLPLYEKRLTRCVLWSLLWSPDPPFYFLLTQFELRDLNFGCTPLGYLIPRDPSPHEGIFFFVFFLELKLLESTVTTSSLISVFTFARDFEVCEDTLLPHPATEQLPNEQNRYGSKGTVFKSKL